MTQIKKSTVVCRSCRNTGRTWHGTLCPCGIEPFPDLSLPLSQETSRDVVAAIDIIHPTLRLDFLNALRDLFCFRCGEKPERCSCNKEDTSV